MTNPATITVSWCDLFDAWENMDRRAFEHYYEFHAIYGLKERDLSPCKRLGEIIDYDEGAGDCFTQSLIGIATDLANIDEEDCADSEIGEEGVTLSLAHAN